MAGRSTGIGRLDINRLDDINRGVGREIVTESVDELRKKFAGVSFAPPE